MVKFLNNNKTVKTPKKTAEDYKEDALYREVWEEVNNEKTTLFVKKYYRILSAAAIGILIIATSIVIINQNHKANRTASVQNYEIAISAQDARALEALAKNNPSATSDLALFQSYMIDKDVKKLDALAKNGKTRDFRDLAKIHLAGILGDTLSPKDFENFLTSLNTKKSPYYYEANLLIAQKYLASGDKKNADIWLNKIINDSDAPAIISGTATSLR